MSWRTTRQQKRRQATIDRLLDCSKFVLQRDGHAMFTLRAVASYAGIRLSNLQHYFESKEHLLIETARHAIDEILTRHRSYKEISTNDPAVILIKMMDRTLEFMSDPIYAGFFLEIWVLSRHSEEIRKVLVDRFEEYFDLFTDLVQGVNPALDRNTAAAMAFTQIAMIEGAVMQATTLKDKPLDVALIRELILGSWQSMWRAGR